MTFLPLFVHKKKIRTVPFPCQDFTRALISIFGPGEMHKVQPYAQGNFWLWMRFPINVTGKLLFPRFLRSRSSCRFG